MPRARNKKSGRSGGAAVGRGGTGENRRTQGGTQGGAQGGAQGRSQASAQGRSQGSTQGRSQGSTQASTQASSGGTAASKARPQPRNDARRAAQADAVPGAARQAQDVPPGLARADSAPPGPAPSGRSDPAPAVDLRSGSPARVGERAGPVPARSAAAPAKGTAANPKGGAPAKGTAANARGAAPAKGTASEPAKVGAKAKPAAQADGEQDDLPAWAAKAAEKLLTVSCWLDPGEHGAPFSATIRFSGRRDGVTGKPQRGDAFAQDETVEGIVPGSGPVAVTTVVRDVNPGEWTVTGRPVVRAAGNPFRAYPPPGGDGAARRVPAPRRVAIPAGPDATIRTRNLLFTKVPGIFRPAYAGLISLGVLAGLALQTALLITAHYSALRPILFSLAAVAAGAVGGKLWYIAVQRGQQRDGYCIQGFIVGAAVVVVAVALAGAGIPAGVYLSVTAPAVLIGISIGRPGCFWAGCCVGRPTASRWGIWSSDRLLGCRRMPAQLLEALASLVIGVAVLAVVLTLGLARSGPVAVAGLAAYTLARQFIVTLRADPPQHWRYGRRATTVVAAVALIASVVLLARGTA
jgi:phosphatidylglycerol---prolipoprotein diacylglyceryl transferase